MDHVGRHNKSNKIKYYLKIYENNFSEIETVQITEKTVNPHGERASPHDFQLLKVLGKGVYGKVRAFKKKIFQYLVLIPHLWLNIEIVVFINIIKIYNFIL